MYRIKFLKGKCVSFVIMKLFFKVWSIKFFDIGGFIQVDILNFRGEKYYWNQSYLYFGLFYFKERIIIFRTIQLYLEIVKIF